MATEFVGGILSGSLALLADSAHTLTDGAAIGIAIVANRLSTIPTTSRRTFGFQRVEVLAAALNALALWGIAAWIVWEAVSRLASPAQQQVNPPLVIAIAAIGIAVNLTAARVLHSSSRHSINVEAARRHIIADLLGSLGVLASGIIILLTQWHFIDSAISILIAAVIALSSWSLIRKSMSILADTVPNHVDVNDLCDEIETLPGVIFVHDVHVFTVNSQYEFMTAHVLMDSNYTGSLWDTQRQIHHIATVSHGIHHVTIQLCRHDSPCSEDHTAGRLPPSSRATRQWESTHSHEH